MESPHYIKRFNPFKSLLMYGAMKWLEFYMELYIAHGIHQASLISLYESIK